MLKNALFWKKRKIRRTVVAKSSITFCGWGQQTPVA